MRTALLAMIVAGTLPLPSPAFSQLISDQVEGRQRVCIYASETGRNEPALQRRALVGLGQNCPGTFPWAIRTDPAPPTASLQSESVVGENRNCIYGQWDRTWTYAMPTRGYCPPTAGLIEQELARPEGRARTRFPTNRRTGE
jgi:hypothetical protein